MQYEEVNQILDDSEDDDGDVSSTESEYFPTDHELDSGSEESDVEPVVAETELAGPQLISDPVSQTSSTSNDTDPIIWSTPPQNFQPKQCIPQFTKLTVRGPVSESQTEL